MTAAERSPLYAPEPPFQAWPEQVHEAEAGFYAWYSEPGVLLTQLHTTHADRRLTDRLGEVVYGIIRGLAAANRELGGTFVVHDWRSLRSVDADARETYAARLRGLQRGEVRGAVMALAPQSPLVRSVVQLAAMIFPLRTGHKLHIVDEASALQRAIDDRGAAAPAPGTPFPTTTQR